MWHVAHLTKRSEPAVHSADSDAIRYAKHRSRSPDAVVRAYDERGNVIEMHEDKASWNSGEVLRDGIHREPANRPFQFDKRSQLLSARAANRFPSQCASTTQFVRPFGSTAENQPKLQGPCLNQSDHTLDMFPQTAEVEVLAHLVPRGWHSRPGVNVFLITLRGSLTNTAVKVRSWLGSLMSEFIIIGIVLILGVNGLYSRFCEKAKEWFRERLDFSRNNRRVLCRRRAVHAALRKAVGI